jgi:hypothetical protein
VEKAVALKIGINSFEARPRSQPVSEESIAELLWMMNKLAEFDGHSPKEFSQLMSCCL